MKPEIRIINTAGKWTNIKYTMSNAKSRIKSDQLKLDYENGVIAIVNPDLLIED